jgi:hypothetical protein
VSVTAVRETAAPADLTSLPPRFTFKTDWGAANKKAGQPIQKNGEKSSDIIRMRKVQTVSLSSLGTSVILGTSGCQCVSHQPTLNLFHIEYS